MCIKINKVGKQEVGIWRVQKRFPQYGIRIWSPVCRLSWFLYTFNIYAHFLSHFSQQILMAEIWYLVTSFIYVPHFVGSVFWPVRFLQWHAYMKLVTKYQIPVINICWEKCDEKCAYMLNVHKNQISRQTGSMHLTGQKTLLTKWGTYMKLVTNYHPCPNCVGEGICNDEGYICYFFTEVIGFYWLMLLLCPG
jgi:hypothetical protein